MGKKKILVTGLVIASVMTAGASVYAAEEVAEDPAAVVQERPEFGQRGQGRGHRDKGEHAFEKAMEEGIVTQEEVDAIKAYHESNRPDFEAIKEATEGMTREERQAYMEENYPRPEDPLQDLVDQGLLTAEQKAQIETLREELREERGLEEGERPERPERPEGSEGQRPEGGGPRGGRGMRPAPTTEEAADKSL